MPYALIGETMRGKSFLAKKLMQRLQNESSVPSSLFLLITFPGEWKPSQKNSDNTVYLKPGNQIFLYDKGKYQYNQLLEKLTRDVFSPELGKRYRIIFIDDNTTDLNNKSPLLNKIYTQGRHGADGKGAIEIIQALHYLNSLHINNKVYVFDWLLFGNQVQDKLKKFWKDMMQQHFEKRQRIDQQGNVIGEKYSFDDFYQMLDDYMEGEDLDDKTKAWHRCIQISFPTKLDNSAIIQKIDPDNQENDLITKNALHKLIK